MNFLIPALWFATATPVLADSLTLLNSERFEANLMGHRGARSEIAERNQNERSMSVSSCNSGKVTKSCGAMRASMATHLGARVERHHLPGK